MKGGHQPGRKVMPVSAATSPAAAWLEANLGEEGVSSRSGGGGSGWSSTEELTTRSGARYFAKMAPGDDTMFRGEALGLQALYDTHTIHVPKVVFAGGINGQDRSMIIMEHLDLKGRANQADLGRALALMHQAEPLDEHARSGQFGFPADNTIGETPQPNGWMDSWVDFFRERRLRHQLRLAGDSRLSQLGEKVLQRMDTLFEGLEIQPSVLHGDLWSGNIGSVDGQPAIFDPATYYGHHEAEFGMSWCAGFGGEFYRAYHELIPRAPGFENRQQLYKLYHYLNHYNLFGGGYYHEAASLLQSLSDKL